MKENGLDLLVKRLLAQEMPIFAGSMKYILSITNRDDSSLLELARVILQDAALTARILKLANSSYYNSSFRRITTISRALVVLGLDRVRNMCLSIAVVETVLKGKSRKRLARETAQAFHAAVQASKFATLSGAGSESEEEVFIAALLYRLGHILFWCHGGELADRLEQAMNEPGCSPAQAEQEVLGFPLRHLTLRLSREWHLSHLLDLTLEGIAPSDSRVRSIKLGYKLVKSLEHGWDSPEAMKAIEEVGRLVKLPGREMKETISGNTKEAARIAQSHGIGEFSELILPLSMSGEEATEFMAPPDDSTEPGGELKEEKPFPEPDPMLQLNILRDLASLVLEGQLDVNLLFSMLLEGIYRGIGMDRVLFAMITPDRQDLRVKHSVGWANQARLLDFAFNVMHYENIFSHTLKVQKPIWVKPNPPPETARLLAGNVTALIRKSPFFLMPILLKGQAIGVIYADRQPSGRELDDDSFSSFCTFGNQVSLYLGSLKG